MRNLDYILLAVRDPLASAELYKKILGTDPVESSPGFVLFVTGNGGKIGLWLAPAMDPKPNPAGGSEISFTEPDRQAVLATHKAWKGYGLTIIQPPTDMPFGFTFTAEDADGHRLRPFVRAANPS
jgi:catechol 2,3-dioxygenase-like lactoylglutathione lyase family enzyme